MMNYESDVVSFCKCWLTGNQNNLYEISQLSWRVSHSVSDMVMPEITTYAIKSIGFYSDVVVDAVIMVKLLGSENWTEYRVRFIAEKAPYKPAVFTRKFFRKVRVPFLFNPISVRK